MHEENYQKTNIGYEFHLPISHGIICLFTVANIVIISGGELQSLQSYKISNKVTSLQLFTLFFK